MTLELITCLEDSIALSCIFKNWATLLDTGANIIRDIAKDKNSRESLQTQGKQIRLEMFNKVNT